MYWFVVDNHSLIAEACKVLIADDAFMIPSPVAENAVQNAKALLEWMEQHKESAIFDNNCYHH